MSGMITTRSARIARRRALVFGILLGLSLGGMALSATAPVKELQSGVGFAFRPFQGAVAGIGASLQGFITTLGGALLGAAIGRQFTATTVPLAAGALCSGLLSLCFALLAERGRLFRPHHPVAAGPAPYNGGGNLTAGGSQS